MKKKAARTVILAAGDFPGRGGEAWKMLAAARFVVACDGAALSYRRRFGRWPDVVIGDMDSLRSRPRSDAVVFVEDADQETNDLEKAVSWCKTHGRTDLVIVGAGGKREDHTIGNVFRALHCMVPVVTDNGVFYPVNGGFSFKTVKGAGVSVFAPDPETKMTSRGLVWPLEGVEFTTLFRATLNRAAGEMVSLESDRPVSVFVETIQSGSRRHLSAASLLKKDG